MASLSTTNLARLSARHPWRAVIAWVVALVVFGAVLQVPFPLQTTTDTKLLNNPESVQGWDMLIERGIRQERSGVESVVVCHPGTRPSTEAEKDIPCGTGGATVDDPAFQAAVRQ